MKKLRTKIAVLYTMFIILTFIMFDIESVLGILYGTVWIGLIINIAIYIVVGGDGDEY